MTKHAFLRLDNQMKPTNKRTLMSPYPWHIGERRLSSADLPCAQQAEPQPRQSRRLPEDRVGFSIKMHSRKLLAGPAKHHQSDAIYTFKQQSY